MTHFLWWNFNRFFGYAKNVFSWNERNCWFAHVINNKADCNSIAYGNFINSNLAKNSPHFGLSLSVWPRNTLDASVSANCKVLKRKFYYLQTSSYVESLKNANDVLALEKSGIMEQNEKWNIINKWSIKLRLKIKTLQLQE